MTSDVIVIDHDTEAREWLAERFTAMATEMVTTWDIAQDIAANWTEGRRVSELPECNGKRPGDVFRDWLALHARAGLGKPSTSLLSQQLHAARIRQLAPPEYRDLDWSLYRNLPADADKGLVADVFRRAAAQPSGLTYRAVQLVQGKASGMKPPYWQQVIENLMTGAFLLTPSTARNIIATAQQWLKENPDADERR